MKDISKLLKEVETYYRKEGRSHLPWRKTKDPYKILVSEIMLQQTQAQRVIPFYNAFLKKFPSASSLAKAPLSAVLKAWQGLGYNRRAKFLQQAAVVLAKEGYKGQKLPGVGPYTQGAIDAFAFNKPSVIIETNIRTVFLYFCFQKPQQTSFFRRNERDPNSSKKKFAGVSDAEILSLVEKALQKTKLEPRDFYAALMDYGSYLKRQGIKINKQSKHYTKQGKFEGSMRQLRGAILRELLIKPQTMVQLAKKLLQKEELLRALEQLQKEELITKRHGLFQVLS